MFPLHLSMFWFGLVVMHPWFVPVKILLCIQVSSPSSPYSKRRCKDRPIRLNFYRPSSSLRTHRAHAFRNSKWSRTMLYAKPWELHIAVVTLYTGILLSPRINSSTPLHSCFCHNLNRATWSGNICDFRKFLENLSIQLWTVLRGKHFPP
jgi:hypothetical protein